MAYDRYLDEIELQAKGNASFRPVAYEGDIDEGALKRAYTILCTRHPMLLGRICPDSRGDLLHVPPGEEPRIVSRDGDENALREEACKPWDLSRTLAQLVHIRGRRRGYVGLRIDHAIVDATGLFALLGELWEHYTAIVEGGQSLPAAAGTMPAPPHELLKQRWGRMNTASWEEENADAGHAGEACDLHYRRIRLNAQDTRAVVEAARYHLITVNTLVCGAILTALRAHSPVTEPARMACLSNVNLRTRVNPSVGATETTNFFTRHRAVVTVPVNADKVAIGRDMKAQIDAAIEHRELPGYGESQLLSFQVESLIGKHLANIHVSSVGIIPRFRQPRDLRITDLINVPTQRIPSWCPIVHVIYTYESRLTIESIYRSISFTRDDVDEVVKRTTAELAMNNPGT